MTAQASTPCMQIDGGRFEGQRLVLGPGSYATTARFKDCVFAVSFHEGLAMFDQCQFLNCFVETEAGLKPFGLYLLESHGKQIAVTGQTQCTDTTTTVSSDFRLDVNYR